MKYVPAGITRTISRQILQTQKHSPTILFAAGMVGFGTTVVLACRATLKINEIVEPVKLTFEKIDRNTHQEGYSEKDAQRDKTLLCIQTAVALGRLYGPAILVGAASVAALTGSHHVLSKRNVGLTAAYAAVERAFAQYRERVLDDVGEERERAYRYPLEACELEDEKGKKKTVMQVGEGSPSMYARLFDNRSSNWNRQPEYNLLFLRCQQTWLNDQLHSRGHVLLNDAYDALGIERTSAGAVVGWIAGKGDDYVDFGIFDREMSPRAFDFFTGHEGAILLDFNVDGIVYDKI